MAEQACSDPPRKGGCCFDPGHILTDPDHLPGGYPLLTVALTREPAPAVLPLLTEVHRVELSRHAPVLDLAAPWTLWLQDLGEEEDLFVLEEHIQRAASRGADHVLVSLARQDMDPTEEYLQRLLSLIRSLCDEAGLTFATVPGLKVNPYLASSKCCRWPK